MSVRGILAVASVESVKLRAQVKVMIVLAVCLAGPFAFAAAMRLQTSLPEDTLFGRHVKESGFATPLVVLGFAALWIFPVLTSVVGGDIFSSEDRYGTWTTLLTRSRSRAEVFMGKLVAALGYSVLAVAALAVSSIAAGWLVIGSQPVVDLSGVLVPPGRALAQVALAWASMLPPAFGFTALAMLLSAITRSGAAGIGLPVVAGLAMQLYAYSDGPEVIRRMLITSAFGAWHGLFNERPYYGPMIEGGVVSGLYFVVCVALAYRAVRRRDVGR